MTVVRGSIHLRQEGLIGGTRLPLVALGGISLADVQQYRGCWHEQIRLFERHASLHEVALLVKVDAIGEELPGGSGVGCVAGGLRGARAGSGRRRRRRKRGGRWLARSGGLGGAWSRECSSLDRIQRRAGLRHRGLNVDDQRTFRLSRGRTRDHPGTADTNNTAQSEPTRHADTVPHTALPAIGQQQLARRKDRHVHFEHGYASRAISRGEAALGSEEGSSFFERDEEARDHRGRGGDGPRRRERRDREACAVGRTQEQARGAGPR